MPLPAGGGRRAFPMKGANFMNGIPNEERQRLGALLDTAPQTEVMGMIPQFSQAEIYNIAAAPAAVPAISP